MPESFDYKEAPDVQMLGEPGGPAPSRRGFLFWLGAALNVVVGLLVAVPILGYVFSSWKRDDWQAWVDLIPGGVDDFPRGQTRMATYRNPPEFDVTWDGYTANTPCWVRRLEDGSFNVFAINCTHLGCPVRWFPESKLFMCPCHGGVYYADGSHAAGPPPRGLYPYKVDQDALKQGRLRILAGRLPTLQETT